MPAKEFMTLLDVLQDRKSRKEQDLSRPLTQSVLLDLHPRK